MSIKITKLGDAMFEVILGFAFSLLANEITSARYKRIEKRLQDKLNDDEALEKFLASHRSFRADIHQAAKELSKNLEFIEITDEDNPLWRLLQDRSFLNLFADWIMAGGIEEGRDLKKKLTARMEKALQAGGSPPEKISFLKDNYFDWLEKAVFSNSTLAHWRHQLSLDYLREQVAELKKQIAEAAGKYSPEKKNAALKRYCELALKAWDIIDLNNLPEGDIQIATQRMLLRNLYIPLRIAVEWESKRTKREDMFAELESRRGQQRRTEAGHFIPDTDDLPQRPSKDKENRYSIGERLATSQKLVVLGDPGGGKTTMLRWMATAYLLKRSNPKVFKELPDIKSLPTDNLVPVLIRCRTLGEADLCSSFSDFLLQHLAKSELKPDEAQIMKAVILELMTTGKVLLMVDGLDEVADPRVRGMFCEELERCAARYPEVLIVVTSRIVGYRDMPYKMGEGFEHGVIAPLTRDDKDRFAQRWVEYTEQHLLTDEKEKKTLELVEALHSSDRIERLTGNPMLLTTLALVKRKVGKLPNRRIDLYREAISVLLNWNPRIYVQIDEHEALPQLEYVAFEMCRLGVQQLPEDEILTLLDRVRVEYSQIHAILSRSSKDFLKHLEERSSILIQAGGLWIKDRETPVYEFRHLTLQEYLAARALIDGRYPDRDKTKSLAQQIAPLAGIIFEYSWFDYQESDSWSEVLRLCLVGCRDDDVDESLLAVLHPLPIEDSTKSTRPRAALAALCLADEPNILPETAKEVIKTFASLVGTNSLIDDTEDLSVFGKSAQELFKSIWAQSLKVELITEFRNRNSIERNVLGELWATIETLNLPENLDELDNYYINLIKRLQSEDFIEINSSTLTIAYLIFQGKVVLIPGLIDNLLILLNGDPPTRFAAVKALYGLSGEWVGPDGKVIKHSWRPKSEDVTLLISAIETTDHTEVDTLIGLIDIIKYSCDRRVVNKIVSFIAHEDQNVQNEAIETLCKLDENLARSEGRKLLLDSIAENRMKGVNILALLTDKNNRNLIAKALEGFSPWLDPNDIIDESRVFGAAVKLKMTCAEVKSRYEALAREYGFKLGWKYKP